MRRDRLYLEDIVKACLKIARFTDGKDFQGLLSDEAAFDATVHNLQIIGEAVMNLPDETRELRPDIEWKRIVGLRHLLVHHYFGIDEEIIWHLASVRTPELLEAAEDMLRHLPEP